MYDVQLCKIVFASNILNSTIRFEIDPETVINALNEAENEGLELIGFFHSHPIKTKLSSVDLKFMKLWSNAIWLIISSETDEIAAYHLKNDEIMEIPIIINCEN